MRTINVRQYLRNGRVVQKHTRSWDNDKYKPTEWKDSSVRSDTAPIVLLSKEELAKRNADQERMARENRERVLEEYKKRKAEEDKSENSIEGLKNQLAYMKKWRDGSRKMKAIEDSRKKAEQEETAPKPTKPIKEKVVKQANKKESSLTKEWAKKLTEKTLEGVSHILYPEHLIDRR